ncbi:MAG: hypothetical protein K9G49_03605 [Taibaiella sp.]|nr:hypothetical protein [Taibaiella sp.]
MESVLCPGVWVSKTTVDEMNDFFYQTLFGMAYCLSKTTDNYEKCIVKET